jgi:phosphoglycolate phosphatase-like HAD superfamily hydrolase
MSMDGMKTIGNREISIIFDVDGTLVDSDPFDVKLYIEAVRATFGEVTIHDDWKLYKHATDAGILKQILEENGLRAARAAVARVRKVFGGKVREYLDRGGTCVPVPGAVEAVVRLKEEQFRVGIATGGWGRTARMKLERAGIPFRGLPLASSDYDLDRVKIMRECLRRLSGDPRRAIYVGNGDWDRRASLEAGWAFIGVGAGLKDQCAVWVADFLDPAWPTAPETSLLRACR